MRPYRVGILGATGLVGQRLALGLAGHPWFRVVALAASERSAGSAYGDIVRWRVGASPPRELLGLPVRECGPSALDDCDLVLSALDTAVARELEPQFAEAGFAVISNSSAYRMDRAVPLLVPEVNSDHLAMLDGRKESGFIVTNPNCSATGLVIAIAPLYRAFGVRRLVVATLQAVSGAGIDGPRGLEMIDNVLPWIPGEEEKLESELQKILGSWSDGTERPASLRASAHCHRVATIDGHLEAVSVELESPATIGDVREALASFAGDEAYRALPSSTERPIVVRQEPDRPQPRLDRDEGNGMAVVVGRVRPCPVLGVKFVLLSHNTVRGAAGGTLLNAELLASRGLLPRRNGA